MNGFVLERCENQDQIFSTRNPPKKQPSTNQEHENLSKLKTIWWISDSHSKSLKKLRKLLISMVNSVCLPYFSNWKSIFWKARLLLVKSDWRKWCAIKRRILWSNQIWLETSVFYRQWIFIFENMASIPSPNEKRWQAYLVRYKTDMASMFGPLFY